MQKRIVNGVEIAFVDRGRGPVLLLVHGFPLDHTMWATQIEGLSQRCRVIAVDLRGFGQSGRLDQSAENAEQLSGANGQLSEGAGQTIEMWQFADDLAGLLDALQIDEPIFLAGLSMGGYVVFSFYFRYPQLVWGLILCDTKAMADTPDVAAVRHETARLAMQNGTDSMIDAMTPRLFAESTRGQRPKLVDSLCRVMRQIDRRTIAAASLGMARREDVRPRLAEIKCPALVIVGSEDVISPPEEMQAIAAGIESSRFVEIAGAGHMTPVERPDEFNAAVLEFIAATENHDLP